MKTTETFRPIEVAYRVPGKPWRRTVCRTQKALDKLLARLDSDAEVHTRDFEGV